MERKKILVIVNPISGTKDKRPIIEALPQHLDPNLFDVEVAYTTHRGHAAELATEAVKCKTDVCVAIGGDGTVNEVARSLRDSSTALAIIPCGSGNGLARHLQIPLQTDGALKVLSQCIIHELDYGMINEYPFFCTCGMGFDAFISERFANSGKRGLRTYIEKALNVGIRYTPETYDIEVDGETEHIKAFLIAAGNASQYGNNFYITPHASMSDGLLDITVMEPFNLIEAPQIVMQMLNKTLDNNSHIRNFQCKSLRVSRSKPGLIHFDGDPVETDKEILIRIVPKGLRVVVNNERSRNSIPPMFNMFQELFDQITGNIKKQQRKILAGYALHFNSDKK